MKRKAILTILLVFSTILAFNQSKDIKASTLLEEVSKKLKSYKSIKVDISYSMENLNLRDRQ